MKKLLITALSSVILLTGLCPGGAAAAPVHPATAILKVYEKELPYIDFFSPYIVSILALNELEHQRHITEVRAFLQWYLDNLNYPDKHGMNGTIYDFHIKNGQQEANQNYDSVDGYSGLFLHLLYKYVLLTGDHSILAGNWTRIDDIAYTLPSLQDAKDGLTVVMPGRDTKYLMDNCESYAGVTAYIELRRLASLPDDPFYGPVQKNIKDGILHHLFDKQNNNFFWALDSVNQHRSGWVVFYPDGFAQIFPLYYDILPEGSPLKRQLWEKFNRAFAGQMPTYPVEQRIIYGLTKEKLAQQGIE